MTRGRKPTVTKSELKKLQRKFSTDNAIGETLGVSRQAVHQLRNKYGIGKVPDRNRVRDAKIKSARKKGTPVNLISERFDLSFSQVYRLLKD